MYSLGLGFFKGFQFIQLTIKAKKKKKKIIHFGGGGWWCKSIRNFRISKNLS